MRGSGWNSIGRLWRTVVDNERSMRSLGDHVPIAIERHDGVWRRGDATIIQKFGHVPPDLGTDSGPVGCAKHVNSRLPVNSAVYPNLGQVDAPPQLTRFAGIGISTSGEDRSPSGALWHYKQLVN